MRAVSACGRPLERGAFDEAPAQRGEGERHHQRDAEGGEEAQRQQVDPAQEEQDRDVPQVDAVGHRPEGDEGPGAGKAREAPGAVRRHGDHRREAGGGRQVAPDPQLDLMRAARGLGGMPEAVDADSAAPSASTASDHPRGMRRPWTSSAASIPSAK